MLHTILIPFKHFLFTWSYKNLFKITGITLFSGIINTGITLTGTCHVIFWYHVNWYHVIHVSSVSENLQFSWWSFGSEGKIYPSPKSMWNDNVPLRRRSRPRKSLTIVAWMSAECDEMTEAEARSGGATRTLALALESLDIVVVAEEEKVIRSL